jgi:hypothetical protein
VYINICPYMNTNNVINFDELIDALIAVVYL